ncbi:MAG: ABC transporter ATP-binding protein [Cellvibrio sp.]|nr:ABC transporter ATP-binding protein [Cellvibrio sp.]
MQAVIQAANVSKSYGKEKVLDNIHLSIPRGKVVGLIGPNGAGKTSLLRGILGLAPVDGDLQVLGMNPKHDREKMIERVSFIADTAVLPNWMTAAQLIDYVAAMHPRFSKEKCLSFLQSTKVGLDKKIGKLSKGMMVQLHLSVIMSIDSELLILDEPTLGLDILYRKQFYAQLLNDFHDADKTIVITTHQVEEIEEVLTDLIFIKEGKIVLNASMDQVAENYIELEVVQEKHHLALAFSPLHQRSTLGGYRMIFEGKSKADLAELGSLRVPALADIFVAKMQGNV